MNRIKKFFLPKLEKKFFIRISILIVATYVIFGHFFIPIIIDGHSMEPTYKHGKVNFCNHLYYSIFSPKRNDVIFVRLAGKNVMYLKRIVALSGETVEFLAGNLLVNGKIVKNPGNTKCNWTLKPRIVNIGNVYVIGDNRTTNIETHVFGQVRSSRIMGVPLW